LKGIGTIPHYSGSSWTNYQKEAIQTSLGIQVIAVGRTAIWQLNPLYFTSNRDVTVSLGPRSLSWHKMIDLWKLDLETFDENYHRRSVIESIIYSEKESMAEPLLEERREPG
jgi:hypothetical protein